MLIPVFLSALQALGLVAICTLAYGWAQRSLPDQKLRRMAIGVILGLGAAVTMLQPYGEIHGVQVDGRNMFLAIATAFGGLSSTLIALSIAIVTRIFIGGNGVVMGLGFMAVICVMAALWSYRTHVTGKRNLNSWFLLGAILSLPLLIFMWKNNIFEPPVIFARLATDMIGALIFGKMFEGEQRRGRRERQLNREASTDPLTGLPNRRALMEFMNHLSPAQRDNMSLLIIDADHFKAINDTHGHTVGDEVLKQLAQSLSSAIRQGDFAARFGGEEFAVLLRSNNDNDGYELADRLRKALSGQHEIEGKQILVTVSVGGTSLAETSPSPSGFDFKALYAKADAALYRAKCLGRDRAVYA